MLDELLERACQLGLASLKGTYVRTAKNDMVSDHFGKLGFELVEPEANGKSLWRYVISPDRVKLNRAIVVNRDQEA